MSTSLFLNLHYLGGGRSLKELCDLEFHKKKVRRYCKECDKQARGILSKKLVTLKKCLFIVVDRFDKKKHLKNLLSVAPKLIDFCDYQNKENQALGLDTTYRLAGFIAQDPIHMDYSTYLAAKKREGSSSDWTWFSKRGIGKVSDSTLF